MGVSARLVVAAGFKPVVRLDRQVSGGFDSHPLPFATRICSMIAQSITNRIIGIGTAGWALGNDSAPLLTTTGITRPET